MAGMMQRGANLVARAMANGLGDTVTYWRKGMTPSLTIASVTRAKRQLDVTDDQGMTVLVESEVFNVAVSDLTWGVPMRGDKITYGSETFEVLPPGPTNSEWEQINNGQTYRVFAKKVA